MASTLTNPLYQFVFSIYRVPIIHLLSASGEFTTTRVE
jgi:hypothetical protein